VQEGVVAVRGAHLSSKRDVGECLCGRWPHGAVSTSRWAGLGAMVIPSLSFQPQARWPVRQAGGRDRPEQPPRRPGPRGPPPGRARFTVSPARLAACMGCSPPSAESPPPLVASVQGTRRLRSCLSLCPPSRRAADSRIRQWLAIYGQWCLVFAKEHVKERAWN
jgi:hypothetical protein